MSSYNYTTIEGEMWTGIAFSQYGSVDYVTDLIAANPDVAVDPVLPAGTRIVIPIVESTTLINSAPWK